MTVKEAHTTRDRDRKIPKTLDEIISSRFADKVRNINHGQDCVMKHGCDHRNSAKALFKKNQPKQSKIGPWNLQVATRPYFFLIFSTAIIQSS